MQDPCCCSRPRMLWLRLPTFYKAPHDQHCTCHWQDLGALDWQREALPKTLLLNGIFQAPLGAERGFARARQCLWCLSHCCPADNFARRQSATRKNALAIEVERVQSWAREPSPSQMFKNNKKQNMEIFVWFYAYKCLYCRQKYFEIALLSNSQSQYSNFKLRTQLSRLATFVSCSDFFLHFYKTTFFYVKVRCELLQSKV